MKRICETFRPWVFIVLACLLVSACSSGFFYRHMDWLLIRFVEGYVNDLKPAQKQFVRADFARLSAELEDQVLPDLQSLLEQLAQDNQISRMDDNLDQYMQQIETLYKRTIGLAEPGITTLALSLDDKQKNQLFDELQRRNKKFYRKYLAKGEAHARKEQLRAVRKNARKWLGKTSPQQNVALQAYDAHYRANEQAWLDSRKRWQAKLKKALYADDVASGRKQLKQLLLRPQHHWTDDYLTAAEHNREVSVALTKALATHMDASQRRRFARELGKNQQKVAAFAQAIAAIRTREIAGLRSAPNVATVVRQ